MRTKLSLRVKILKQGNAIVVQVVYRTSRCTVRTRTSKHSEVRCCLVIGSKVTGLYNRHEAEMVIRACGRGVIFGLAKHSVPDGGDVVINVGTTWLPLDLWSLDQRSKQR